MAVQIVCRQRQKVDKRAVCSVQVSQQKMQISFSLSPLELEGLSKDERIVCQLTAHLVAHYKAALESHIFPRYLWRFAVHQTQEIKDNNNLHSFGETTT